MSKAFAGLELDTYVDDCDDHNQLLLRNRRLSWIRRSAKRSQSLRVGKQKHLVGFLGPQDGNHGLVLYLVHDLVPSRDRLP